LPKSQKVTQFHSTHVNVTLCCHTSCHKVHYDAQNGKHWLLLTANLRLLLCSTLLISGVLHITLGI